MKTPAPATLACLLVLVPALGRAAAPAGVPNWRGVASQLGGALNGNNPAPSTPPVATDSAKSAANTVVSNANSSSTQSNSLESNTLLTVLNKAFNTDSDSIDPENGTMKWKGHSYSLGEMRAFRSRFEQYLSLSPSPDEQAYQAALDRVTALLATNNTGDMNENTKQAWQALYEAAEFSADGGYALSVANQVFDTWRIRNESDAQRVAGLALDHVRKQQQATLTHNLDYAQLEAAQQGSNYGRDLITAAEILAPLSQTADSASGRGAAGASGTTSTGSSPGSSGVTAQPTNRNPKDANFGLTKSVGAASIVAGMREQVGLEAQIKAMQAAQALSGVQAKLQFQGEIINLFLQRRFQHALIASSFYRAIFKGTAQELDPKYKEAIADFLPPSGNVPFYISTIENLSREAIDQARKGMAAVRSNYDDGMLMAATERLQETFFLGEYVGEITQFEKTRRQKIYAFYRKVEQARKLADLKDYEAIVKINTEIGALTKDFRSAEVTAAARAAEQGSQLALAGAKQAASNGDFDRAQTLTEKASNLWPLNPDIAAYGSGVAAGATISSQAAIMFDDAYKHSEYRRIYERQGELSVGLANDALRGPKFKEVITRMTKVETALGLAQEAVSQNNAAVAWDTLTAAAELVPNDVTVNQRKAELAPRVADYVGLADKAKRAEDNGDTASSLAYYLAVQDMNPASPLARLGIERVTSKLLAQLAGELGSATPGKN